jgi:hypothetical protein
MYFRNVGNTAHIHRGQRPKRKMDVKTVHSENQNSVNTYIHLPALVQFTTHSLLEDCRLIVEKRFERRNGLGSYAGGSLRSW